jgi:hypothetical protein
LDTKCDGEAGKKFIEEALEMREKKRKLCNDVFTPKPLHTITLIQGLSAKTWLAVGESLVQLHQHIEANGIIRVSVWCIISNLFKIVLCNFLVQYVMSSVILKHIREINF